MENGAKFEEIENTEIFSTPAEKEYIFRAPDYVPARSLPEFYWLNCYFRMDAHTGEVLEAAPHGREYLKWLMTPKKGGITSYENANNYSFGIARARQIKKPSDFYNYDKIPPSPNGKKWNEHTQPNLTDARKGGATKFLSYLRDVELIEELAGFDMDSWLTKTKAAPKGNSFEDADEKIPTTEEILKGYPLIREDLKPYFLLMLFSGARNSQLFAALRSDTRHFELLGKHGNNEQFKKLPADVLFMDCRKQASGHKLTFSYVLPAELQNIAEGYRIPDRLKGSKSLGSAVNASLSALPDEDRFTLKGLRKWQFNALCDAAGLALDDDEGRRVLEKDIDNIQGRDLTTTTGDRNYRAIKNKVVIAYSKIVDELLKLFPIPAEMVNYKPDTSRKKPSGIKKEVDETALYEMANAKGAKGENKFSNHEIMAKFGISSERLSKFCKTQGINRSKQRK